ncbi:MAG: outer membrane beta-barrel protein [Saprospiraceae bacterium]|nr:outer membrane beta-barrel protein [Saprospiraceae bacterium]
MKFRLTLACLLFYVLAYSQSIGVRAGWNFNTFSGPLEANESYGSTNGIHFGINYGYKLSNIFMVRGELLYNQTGTKHKYDGSSYYQIYTAEKTVYERGRRLLDLEISTSYVSLPLTAVVQLGKKIEVFGGFSPNFLVNPSGRGTVRFYSDLHPTEIVFKQALDYSYYNDKALGSSTTNSGLLRIIVDGEVVTMPKIVGAYYQNDVKNGSRFNWFNLSALGGINYFLNKGFFIGGRVEYGLLDTTNDKMDNSLEKLNDDFTLIKRNDKDIQLTYQLSLGFRF